MSHPDGLPDLFVDRSLGRIKVPDLLRAAGLRLINLSEHYGVPGDENIADTEWRFTTYRLSSHRAGSGERHRRA